MPVPVVLSILAQRDPSVQATFDQINSALEELKKGSSFTPTKGLDEVAKKALSDLKEAAKQASVGQDVTLISSDQVATSQAVVAQLQRWKSENQEILSQSKKLAAEFAVIEEEAQKIADASRQNYESIAQYAQAASVRSIALGAGLTAAVTGSVAVAGRFEQLQAKLVTFKGTVEEANRAFVGAQEFASKTPFDVEGLVTATATLESFKQRSETILPRVAKLAAGLSKDIEGTSLVVAKALSGSTEGFESLRNEYGITTQELKKNGAAVNEQNELMLRGEANIEKARQALLKIIDTRFGDAIERQSRTMNGALSNLGDAAKNLAASTGQTLIPIVTSGISGLTSILDGLNKAVSPTFKGIVAGGALVVGGLLIMGGVAVGLAGSIGLLHLQLVQMNAQLALAGQTSALATRGLALTTLATRGVSTIGSVGSASLSSMLGPLGLLLVGVAALSVAVIKVEGDFRALGQQIDDQSKKSQKIVNDFRSIIDVLNKAGGNVTIDPKAAQQAETLAKAIKDIPADRLASEFQKAGLSGTDLKNKIEETTRSSQDAQKQIGLYAQAIQKLQDAADSTEVSEVNKNLAEAEKFARQAGFTGVVSMDALKFALRGVNEELNKAANTRTVLTEVAKVFEQFVSPVEKARENLAKLKDFLDYSKELNSTKALTASLKELTSQREANQSLPGIKGKSREQLTLDLANPGISSAVKDAIKLQLDLEKQIADINKRIANKAKKAENDKTKARELAFAREKSLRDVSAAEELRFVESQLATVKKGTQEEVRLLEQAKGLKKQIREKEKKDAESAFSTTLADAKAAAEEQKNIPGATAAGNVQALDEVLVKLAEWRRQNEALINRVPELKKRYDDAVRSVNVDKIREAARIPAENFQTLKTRIADFTADAVTNQQKLDASKRASALIEAAAAKGLIDQKKAQVELIGLAKQRAQAEQAVTNELNAQKQELLSLDTQNLDSEIQILEERKQAGENVERQLKKAREDRLRASLEAIELERQAAIDAGKSVEQADAVAGRKREALFKSETLKRVQEQNKNRQSSQGQSGNFFDPETLSQSPGSYNGGFLPSFSSPSFSLPSFGIGKSVPNLGGTSPEELRSQFNSTQLRVRDEIGQRSRELDSRNTAVAGAASSRAGDNYNVTINVDGRTVDKNGDGGYLNDLKKRSTHVNNVFGPNRNPIHASTKF